MPEPAKTVAAPVELIFTIRLLFDTAYTTPAGPTAIALGPETLAKVEVLPVGDTLRTTL